MVESDPQTVGWLISSKSLDPTTVSKSNLASIRLRAAVAAEEIARNCGDFKFIDSLNVDTLDLLIVGKIDCQTDPERASRWQEVISNVKDQGGTIILDYTDHLLPLKTAAAEFYKSIIKEVDFVVCSSETLKRNISSYTDAGVMVIPDPIEVKFQLPKHSENKIPNVLWFGHSSNLSYLVNFLNSRLDYGRKFNLVVISNLRDWIKDFKSKLDSRKMENITIQYMPWTLNVLESIAPSIDFTILPAGVDDSRKNGASSNRLMTSLSLGLRTLADDLDSYKPFTKYYTKLTDEMFTNALTSPSTNHFNTILEAQKLIAANFTKDTIGKAWSRIINEKLNDAKNCGIYKTQKKKSMDMKKENIRLNLGCGDKILEGYINVDVVASRAGKKPDVICDLHKLEPFHDDSVDEILAVHVVEHFWEWEVIAILKEWVRVLKPGGKMVLECPNLISAAQEFLKNPDVSAVGGKEGQRSMWVFYGDPAWKDPYMIHRWGYTPKSLARVMFKAGLESIRQEPAQFKLREPRDMRITGVKRNLITASQQDRK